MVHSYNISGRLYLYILIAIMRIYVFIHTKITTNYTYSVHTCEGQVQL